MQRVPADRFLDPLKQDSAADNGKAREARAIVEERLWKRFFEDPSSWWDTRGNKKLSSYPDFKHAAKGQSLWIDSWFRPEWVAAKLECLEAPAQADGRGTRARFKTMSSLPHRDVVNNHSSLEPLTSYENLRRSGSRPSIPVIISALKACSRSGNLQAGKTIHDQLSQTGDLSNKFVISTLVGFYARCGSMEDARALFEGSAERDVVLWNCLIFGYANQGQGREALRLYHRMLAEDCEQDHVTFLAALKACLCLVEKDTGTSAARVLVLDEVKALHSQARRTGNEDHIFVGNSLVDLYAKCGSMLDARRTFDRISRKSLVTWTVMISGYALNGEGNLALQLYRQMQDEGFEADALTFVAVLKACVKVAETTEQSKLGECLEIGKGVHDQVVKAGFEQHMFVASSLVDMYSKCGSLVDARNVFERMKQRSVVSWTAIILGYAENGEADVALEMFGKMQESGVQADAVTYVSALKACSSLAESESKENWTKLDCLEKVREIHAQTLNQNHDEHDMFVGSTLVDSYAKCGSMVDARKVFEAMQIRSVVSWTSIIQGYAEDGKGMEALQLFQRMQEGGCVPDAVTLAAAFRACIALLVDAYNTKLQAVKLLHCQAIKAGLEDSKLLETTVVEVYGKCRATDHARRQFDNLTDLGSNVAAWNLMMLMYAENGQGSMALELYRQMQEQGCSRDAVTYVALLKSCASLAALESGKQISSEIFNCGLHKRLMIVNSIIDFYGKCGALADALRVFECMEKRDVVTWNSLLDGYSRNGDADNALDVFKKMKRCEQVLPNDVTYLTVLAVCSHAGLVDEGRRYFEEMEKVYGLVAGFKHYTCMVDMLGRVNRLEEAMEMINKSTEVDVVMWKALLAAARKWKNEEIGKVAFERVVRLEKPENLAAPYVLMANTYI